MKVVIALLVIGVVIGAFFVLRKKDKTSQVEKPKEIKSAEEVKTKETKSVEEAKKPELAGDLKLLDKSVDEIKAEIQKSLEAGASEYGMSVEEFAPLLDELYSQIDSAKEELFRAVENKDYETIDKLTHSIKGAALNMKIDILGLPLQEINRAARREEPIENIKYYVEFFYEKYEALK